MIETICQNIKSDSEDKLFQRKACYVNISILNQNILLSDDNILDNMTTEDIFDGVVIEVSGDLDASNMIIADYIRLTDIGN